MDVTDDLSARDAKLISTPLNFLQIRECWCLLGMGLWRWRIRVNQQYGLRPSMKTWKMWIFISFSHPMSSRSDSECGAYHLLSGARVGDGPLFCRAQGTAPRRSSEHFIGMNIASASRHSLVVFLGLMLGKCRSSVGRGLLLVVKQELTCGLSLL